MELEAVATQNIEVQECEYNAQETKCLGRITWRMTREAVWPEFRVIFG